MEVIERHPHGWEERNECDECVLKGLDRCVVGEVDKDHDKVGEEHNKARGGGRVQGEGAAHARGGREAQGGRGERGRPGMRNPG